MLINALTCVYVYVHICAYGTIHSFKNTLRNASNVASLHCPKNARACHVLPTLLSDCQWGSGVSDGLKKKKKKK